MAFRLNSNFKENTYLIAEFSLSILLMMKDANFKWFILVPKVPNTREIIDLDEKDRNMLMDEICLVSKVLKETYAPYKLNIAALGNIVEQLHVHIILRNLDDPLYPKTIWGHDLPQKNYTQEEVERIINLFKNVSYKS